MRERRKADRIYETCKAILFDHTSLTWDSIQDTIIRLEHEEYGSHAFSPVYLREKIENPLNTVVLLLDESTESIVGFLYAIDWFYEGNKRETDTVLLDDIIIDKQYRGHGLVSKMMMVFEKDVRRKGYTHFESSTAIAYNFAQKFAKVYKDRILSSEPINSEWGPQIHYRIRL